MQFTAIANRFYVVTVVVAAAFVLAMVAVAAYMLFAGRSALALPPPAGPHSVGRTEFDWVDKSRADTLADTPTGPRELIVWAWYPASIGASPRPAPYLPKAWAAAYARQEGTARLIEHRLDKIDTHSYVDAAVAGSDSVYPVIVMQPGLGRMPTDYTVFAEALASNGFVVFGINPTDSANVTVFPDGRVVRSSEKGTIPASADAVTVRKDARRIGKVWQADAAFVMDRVQQLDADPSSRFHNRLDLTRIGLFGHSFGGATAYEVCARDPRCKAGADLDGTLWTAMGEAVMKRPFMFVVEGDCGHSCETMREGYLRATASAYYLTIRGTRHFNFSDLPLRLSKPARAMFNSIIGPIAPARALAITRASLVAFFDQTLAGEGGRTLGKSMSSYKEAHLRTKWEQARVERFLHAR